MSIKPFCSVPFFHECQFLQTLLYKSIKLTDSWKFHYTTSSPPLILAICYRLLPTVVLKP